MDKIGVALIGCGFFGSMHGEIYKDMSNVDLKVVCDKSLEKARKLALRLNVDFTDNINKVLKRNDINVMDICLPDNMHFEIAKKSLEAEKHIFIEKPLTDNLEKAKKLCKYINNYNKKVMVGHILRFNERSEKAFEIIRNGEIGEIIHLSSKRLCPITVARKSAKHFDVTTRSGIHDFDLARWLVKSEYKSVFAKGRKIKLKSESYESFDSVLSIFTFKNGVIYSCENSWVLPEKYPEYVEGEINIIGTKGCINLQFNNKGFVLCTDEKYFRPDIMHWPYTFGYRSGDLRKELVHFIDCILNDQMPRVTIEDGYKAIEAACKVLESVRERREISII